MADAFFGIRTRLPITIWLTLLFLMFKGMSSVGYLRGLSQTCRSPRMPLFSMAFSAVLFLIFELDRGHEGMLRISQQPLRELADRLLTEQLDTDEQLQNASCQLLRQQVANSDAPVLYC